MRGEISRRAFLGGMATEPPRAAAATPARPAHAAADPAGDVRLLARALPSCLAARAVYCRSCAEICPEGALRIRPLPRGLAEVAIDPDRCTGCGDCLAVCPADALILVEEDAHAP